jgi:hypothetical protein
MLFLFQGHLAIVNFDQEYNLEVDGGALYKN